MNYKKWVKTWFFFIIILIPIFSVFNYLIDPYGYFTQKNKFIQELTRINKPIVLNTKLYTRGKLYIVGTSRQMRVNPQLIQKYNGKYTQNINISGSTFTEDLMVAEKVKKLKKNFIYGFDCFSLNKYRIEHFDDILNRYKTYKNELSKNNQILVLLKGMLNIDLFFESTKVLINQYLFKQKFSLVEIEENNKLCDYNKTRIIDKFNGKASESVYKNYTIYKSKKIIELAKIADRDDIFIIYPQYFFYYKMFQKYQNIEDKYFYAIKLLVNNTKAKVWIFYGINDLTLNKDNFDTDGWHFKPKIAKIIYNEVYGKSHTKNGILLTKNNVDENLNMIKNQIKNYNSVPQN